MFLNPKFLLVAPPSPLRHLLEAELEAIGPITLIDPVSEPFSDPAACIAYVSLSRPDVVIHLSSDLPPSNQASNPKIPSALQHGLVGTDALYVHLSSINLFSGASETPLTEENQPDSTDPKALTEKDVQESLDTEFVRTLIIRLGAFSEELHLGQFLEKARGRRHVTLDPGNRFILI